MTTLKKLLGPTKPTIPQAEIMQMTDKELLFMKNWNGPDSVTKGDLEANKALLERMAPYIGAMSDASRTALIQAIADRKAGVVFHVANPEAALWKTGGAVYYDRTKMYLQQATGEVTAVPNTIIPDPSGRRKNGLVPLSVLMSSLLKVKSGEITLLHDPTTYHKRWVMENPPFNPVRFLELVGLFQKLVSVLPVWKTVESEESTLTNERLTEFIYTCLYDMEDISYYYLHTFVVFEILNVFERVKNPGEGESKFSLIRKKVNGKFAVPESAYTVIPKKDLAISTFNEIRSEGYPVVVVFRGGVTPNIKVTRNSDMAAAVAAKATSITTRGSDKSAMSFLCRNAPYSGLSTEEVRTLQRCVAMVGGVIKSGVTMLDVDVASVSHVAILYTSLNEHFPTVNWTLTMTNENAMKCNAAYQSKISIDRRPGSHYVRYVPFQMQSHSLKKKEGGEEMIQVSLKNYNDDSTKWRPHSEYSGYTIYTPLFGYYPWAVPAEVSTAGSSSAQSQTRGYNERILPKNPHFVYKFGQTESFCGIVTTVQDYALFGQDVQVKAVKTTSGSRTEVSFTHVAQTLSRVASETQWYTKVIESNAAMESYWMHARPKYSPISNVLRIPRQGVSVTYNTLGDIEIVDQGDYVVVDTDDYGQEELDQHLVDKEEDYDGYSYSDEQDDETESEEEGESEPPSEIPLRLPPRPTVLETQQKERPKEEVEEEDIPVKRQKGKPKPKQSAKDETRVLVLSDDQM